MMFDWKRHFYISDDNACMWVRPATRQGEAFLASLEPNDHWRTFCTGYSAFDYDEFARVFGPFCGDPGCVGYGTFDTGADVRIQRCDECETFEDDDAAALDAWRHFAALFTGRLGDDANGALCTILDALTDAVQGGDDSLSERAELVRDCLQELGVAVRRAAGE